VRLFFALTGALLDAGIACWDAKRFFDSVRPISAVRYLFAGQEVEAWGGPGQGRRRILGETWQPYIATPPFGEFPSGHSTFSAAAAADQAGRSRRFGGIHFKDGDLVGRAMGCLVGARAWYAAAALYAGRHRPGRRGD
jgi:membrane-associated phospholipid phosphatase